MGYVAEESTCSYQVGELVRKCKGTGNHACPIFLTKIHLLGNLLLLPGRQMSEDTENIQKVMLMDLPPHGRMYWE